jgi:hypothetical protein
MAYNSDGRPVYDAGTSDQDPRTFQFGERVAYVQVAQASRDVYSKPRVDADGHPIATLFRALNPADVGVSNSVIAFTFHPNRKLGGVNKAVRALDNYAGNNRSALQQDTMGMHFRDPLDATKHDGVLCLMLNNLPAANMSEMLSQIQVEGGINEAQMRGHYVDGTNQYGNALGLAVTGIVPLHLHDAVVHRPPILSNAYAVPIGLTDDKTGPQKTLRIISGNEIRHIFGLNHRLRQWAKSYYAIVALGQKRFQYEDGALEDPTSMPHVTEAAGEFHKASLLHVLSTALALVNAFPDAVGKQFDAARRAQGGAVLDLLADSVDNITSPVGGKLTQDDQDALNGILRSADQSGSVAYSHLTKEFATTNPGQPTPPVFASVDIMSNGAAAVAAMIRHDHTLGVSMQQSVTGSHKFVRRALSMVNQPETFSPASRMVQTGEEYKKMTDNLKLGVITKANMQSRLVMVKRVDN